MPVITIITVLLMLLASFIWWRGVSRIVAAPTYPAYTRFGPRGYARRLIAITFVYVVLIAGCAAFWSLFAQLFQDAR